MSLAEVEYEKKVLFLSADEGWFNLPAWVRYTRAVAEAETPVPRPLTRADVMRVVNARKAPAAAAPKPQPVASKTAAPKPAAPKPAKPSVRSALLAEKARLEREIDRSRAAANVRVLGRDLTARERAICAESGCTELDFATQKARMQPEAAR